MIGYLLRMLAALLVGVALGTLVVGPAAEFYGVPWPVAALGLAVGVALVQAGWRRARRRLRNHARNGLLDP